MNSDTEKARPPNVSCEVLICKKFGVGTPRSRAIFTAAAALANRLPSGYRSAIFANSGPERLSTNHASLENPLFAYSTDFCHPIQRNVATQSRGFLPPSPRNVATLGA